MKTLLFGILQKDYHNLRLVLTNGINCIVTIMTKLFVVPFDDKLEMHVGEERTQLCKQVIEARDCFKGQKPILEGTCDERLTDLFEHGTYEGHGIGIVGDFQFKDLKTPYEFLPTKQSIEKNNFVLYNNYHK